MTESIIENPTILDDIQKVKDAQQMVSDLCQGRRQWTMSIPAKPDYDPDLVIAEALRRSLAALTRMALPKVEAERIAELEKRIHSLEAQQRSNQHVIDMHTPIGPNPEYQKQMQKDRDKVLERLCAGLPKPPGESA